MPWSADPVAEFRRHAQATVDGASSDPGVRALEAEHDGQLPPWWRRDPAGSDDLDITEFYVLTRSTAEAALRHLAGAAVVRVDPRDAEAVAPITDLDEVCHVGVSVTIPSSPLFFDFQRDVGSGVPLGAPLGIDPRPELVASLVWREDAVLHVIPIADDGRGQPRGWGHIMFDSTREADIAFYARPDWSIYGPPGVGLIEPSINLFSRSLCGATFRGAHVMVHRILGLLAAIERGEFILRAGMLVRA